jgi:hypothetical protein
MRKLAEDGLLKMYRSFLDSGENSVIALQRLGRGQGLRLKVLAKAIENGRSLCNDQIAADMMRMKDEEESFSSQRLQVQPQRPLEHENLLRLRPLVTDPQTGNMMLHLSGLMESVLGYDPKQNVTHAEFIARERRMENESIEKARAAGRHPNPNLCRMCREFAKPLRPTADGFELTAAENFLPFGNFFQLASGKNCSFCRLILSMISTESGDLHPRLAAMDPEVQGVRLSTGRLSSGEKLMRVDYGMRQVGELRILTSKTYRQVIRQALQPLGPNQTISNMISDPYLPINNRLLQTVNFGLIEWWLNSCDASHSPACNSRRTGEKLEEDIPLAFIDVNQQCLVTASTKEKYFALSYVWGRVDIPKTVRENHARRQGPGALQAETLLRTVSDAMWLVRTFGEWFLWVDTLCLVHDDQDQMAKDIPHMDRVRVRKSFCGYRGHARGDANAGLPGAGMATRAPQRIETIEVSNRSPDLDYDPQHDNNETIALVETPRPLHLALGLSKWNTRAWVLQERLLARRCIYFSSEAVYFQRNRETLCEGGANEEYKAYMLDKLPLDDEHVLRAAITITPCQFWTACPTLIRVLGVAQPSSLTRTLSRHIVSATYPSRATF